ncbi:MAG: hypothetical protein ACYTEZ_00230 [Planctomycetota bacterium]|jgi:hypothetical protein
MSKADFMEHAAPQIYVYLLGKYGAPATTPEDVAADKAKLGRDANAEDIELAETIGMLAWWLADVLARMRTAVESPDEE